MKISKLLLLLFLANLALGVGQFSLATLLSSDGQKLGQLQEKINQIQTVNKQTENTIVQLMAVENIKSQAEKSGLAKAETEFINLNHEVAFKAN